MVLRASLAAAPLVLLAILGPAVFAACSGTSGTAGSPALDAGSDSGATCQPFVPPSTFNPSSPAVSFANDVLPILELSCNFSSCHGSTTTSQAGLYLGTRGALVYANLVGVASTELPSMARIKAGDPANSFLLHRIEGDACTLAGCTTTICNELMPQGGPPLDATKVLTVRAWVAQGAVNDLVEADAGSSPDASEAGGD
jgi:hypothetical protein